MSTSLDGVNCEFKPTEICLRVDLELNLAHPDVLLNAYYQNCGVLQKPLTVLVTRYTHRIQIHTKTIASLSLELEKRFWIIPSYVNQCTRGR